MAATKAATHKMRQEPVFPSRNSFEFFLEEVEHAARGAGVKCDNIPPIMELLQGKYGQGLPEEEAP